MVLTELTVHVRGDVVIVEPSGRLVLCEEELSPLVAKLLDQEYRKFLLNLRRVKYLDSSSLGGIVRSFTLVSRRGGRLTLCCCVERVVKVLVEAKLSQVFQVFESEDEAIRSFEALSSVVVDRPADLE
jgi:anti-sigma B factor antagonist